MWVSKQSKKRGTEAAAQVGLVTAGGQENGIYLGTQRCGLPVLAPGGYRWRPKTGEQVLVAGADIAEKLLGLTTQQLLHPVETLSKSTFPGLRLIPYRSVGQPGAMLLAVRFQNARVGKRQMHPLVAFAPQRIAAGEMYQMLTGGVI